ncbi:MAG TPA: hypothetical protein VGJ93_12240 [Desulfuromonadaceae bacterium]
MNKLRLLKKLNDEGLFECLTGEELHAFLIMIAWSRENGEGKILPGQIGRAFGRDFSPERFKGICAKLEEKHLVVITTSQPRHGTGLGVTYRILFASTTC